MIPKEILTKYHLRTLEEFKAFDGGGIYAEIGFYQTFLMQTDHIPNKILENLLEELANATLLNFIEVFLKFVISIRTEYKDILQYRKLAREKINELETQSATP